jgi:hypothetical protein
MAKSKKMELVVSNSRVDLSIEKDAGNQILILMGGLANPAYCKESWKNLRKLCDEALETLKSF